MLISNNKGVNVLAALIAILILAAMGAGMAYFIASNQQTRIQQVTSDQAFNGVQAGLEFVLGQILEEAWPGAAITRHFSGNEISITRSGGIVTVTSTGNTATDTYSIDDPTPPTVDCLDVDTTGATVGGGGNKQLQNITITRSASCTNPVTLTSMTGTTWIPDSGELLDRIRIDGTNRFTGPADSSGGTFDFGALDVVINDAAAHPLNFVRWDSDMLAHNFQLHINYEYGGSPYTELVNVNFLAANQADCFTWNTSNAQLSWAGNRWRHLTGTTVQNTCAEDIALDTMNISWTPTSPSRNLSTVGIDGTDIFSGTASSGTTIDVDALIAGLDTVDVDYFDFDEEMLDRDYSVTWTFADATATVTPLTLFASNQNTCFSVDNSAAMVVGKEILGLTHNNSCPQDIGLTDLTLSWSADPSNNLRKSIIENTNGVITFLSNASTPASVSFGDKDLYVRNEDSLPLDITSFDFQNNLATGQTYSLEFTMADSTTYSTSFSVSTQASDLTVDTTGAAIGGGGDRFITGITITNTGASTIVWDRMRISWTPTAPNRKWQAVRVDGVDVFSGNANSGQAKNITNVSIPSGDTLDINFIRCNGDMSGRNITIEFIMQDLSTHTEGPFSPPG
ncbi:hypothetical protein KJ708_08845 [bacterium]|nr:hypothetical protein [bacterium]MBU1916774.1 hypothetical protein [bacterium]